MNVFDVGGIVTAIAVIFTFLIGTGIFVSLNKMLDIWYLGTGAMVTEWLVCCVIAALLVNFLAGIVGGVFSILWVLIRIVLSILVISSIVMFLYKKVKKS